MTNLRWLVATSLLLFVADAALADNFRWRPGLNKQARQELEAAGLTKYVDAFDPVASVPIEDDWVAHLFDPDNAQKPAGPACIVGSQYSVFTKAKDPDKVLIFLQGGGACWNDFYNCNPLAEAQAPPPPPVGIWGDTFDPGTGAIENPLKDFSIVYLPYCDGSVFTGDNDVFDPKYPAAVAEQTKLPVELFPPFRFHRGLQNLTAGIDIAKDEFPHARKIVVAGSSAGGVGAASFAPFLARFAYGNFQDVAVFNDAGPNAINLLDIAGLLARQADWRFDQFYPASCDECDPLGQGTGIVKWRLENDRTIRESFYSTDGDTTNRFFVRVPTQELYRQLIVTEHGEINAQYPRRYKRFIQSGSTSHTALQTPLYYIGTANGVPLYRWTEDFVFPLRPFFRAIARGDRRWWKARSEWVDIVEPFTPAP
jgi:hypothetical protein